MLNSFHAADGGLEPGGQTIDLVKMSGEMPRSQPEWIVRPGTIIKDVMLQEIVDNGMVGGGARGCAPCRSPPARLRV